MEYSELHKQKLALLGNHIKKLRENLNITLKKLSEKTGIRISYLKKIEEGSAYGLLINRHLGMIAKALNVNMGELFNFEEHS